MNTYIISSKNLESGVVEADKINDKFKVSKFDREVLVFEKALGIEDVRNIQKKNISKTFPGRKKIYNFKTFKRRNAGCTKFHAKTSGRTTRKLYNYFN